MNDQPVQAAKLQPAMIHIDLSNAIPARAYNYLTAFLPGLFFEVSLTLANPAIVNKVAANLPAGFPLSQYIKLGIVLFLAFVIGNGVMMGVGLIQWMLGYIYLWGVLLRKKFYSRFLWPVSQELLKRYPGKQGGGSPRWIVKLNRYAFFMIHDRYRNDLRTANECLHKIVRQLLEMKYGLKLEDFTHEFNWQIFSVTLSRPTREEMRGETLIIATHATGWCGLVAACLAPALQNRYYLSFNGLLIVIGLLHCFYLTRTQNNPVLSSLMNIRGLLREFQEPIRRGAPRSKSEPEIGI